MIKKIALDYFQAFASRDLDQVKKFFSAEVSLRDWNISANTLDEVLAANRCIFESVTSISVKPLMIVSEGNTVIAELDISIDLGVNLKVVDIIEFNSINKISAIRAFKG